MFIAKEIDIFKDFIFDNLGKEFSVKKYGNDSIIGTAFKKAKKEYYLIARFSKDGLYCGGYLANEKGEALVNGKGFSLESFLELVKLEIDYINGIKK